MKYFLANCVVSIFIIRDVSTGDSEIKEVTVEPEKKQEESQEVCLLRVSYEQPPLSYSRKHVFVSFIISLTLDF